MIDYEEIAQEIERLENGETTYGNCEKLSILYTVISNARKQSRSSFDSEFINAFYSVPIDHALQVLDEHFNALKLVYPKEYSLVIDKMVSLK